MNNKIPPIFLFLIVLCLSIKGNAQAIILNEDGGVPDSSAILELRSTDQGFLIPRMAAYNRTLIQSPAKGLLIYQTTGVQGFYYYDGIQWDTLDGNKVVNNITSVNNTRIAIIRDLKPSSTDGGTFTSGIWDTRDLTDLQGDSSLVSIEGDSSFSLVPGLYEISITAPARLVGAHQIRLVNVDSNTTVGLGTAVNSAAATTTSELYIVFKIEVTTKFEVQHRCATTSLNTNAKGYAIPWGDCIYTQIKIQQFN